MDWGHFLGGMGRAPFLCDIPEVGISSHHM
jgi:hypothetical protein